MTDERSPRIGELVVVNDDGTEVEESIVNTGEKNEKGNYVVDSENFTDVEVEWDDSEEVWKDVSEQEEEEDEE